MRGHCHLASITGIGHFRLPGRMDGIPTLPVLHGLREPNAPSQILGESAIRRGYVLPQV